MRGDEFLFLPVFEPVLEDSGYRSGLARPALPAKAVRAAAVLAKLAPSIMPVSKLETLATRPGLNHREPAAAEDRQSHLSIDATWETNESQPTEPGASGWRATRRNYLHWTRRIVRRTNSAELIAAAIARGLGVPLAHRAIARVRVTRRQGPMLRSHRLLNVRGAFRLREGFAVRGRRLILVDDIMTTGATCDEVAKVLKRAGAALVTVAVLARADSIY